jgi:hypothetical protein
LTGVISLAPFGSNAPLGELVIDKDLTIVGPGADRLAISGRFVVRVFRIDSGQVRISGLTIRDGYVYGAWGGDATLLTPGGAGEDASGGGILNLGDLTLSDCMVTTNKVFGGLGGAGGGNLVTGNLQPGAGGTGGRGLGAGICNSNRLTLLRCALVMNGASGGWGGLGGQDFGSGTAPGGTGGAGGGAYGGGVFNAGFLAATNCTFFTNYILGGNGYLGGEGIPTGGRGGEGGAAFGAGLCDVGTGTVVHCTFTANRGEPGPAGAGGPGNVSPGLPGAPSISAGGGLYSEVSARTYLRNNLTAGNHADFYRDALGRITSGGFNFVGTFNDGASTVSPFTEPTDHVGLWPTILDPRLGPLDYFGGPTLVVSLLPDSPAIDQGHSSGAATDQRGVPRPRDLAAIPNVPGGDGSDIGAFEYGSTAPPPALTIRLGAPVTGVNTVILTWPNPSIGYVLQQTAKMDAPDGGWADVTQTPVVDGRNQEVTLPATGRFCLFRLRHP